MTDVLFLAHRLPYPPDKGEKIRSFHILQGLAAHYRVHLGCFVDDPDDWRHVARLEEICDQTCFLPWHSRRLAAAAIPALLGGEALSVAAYRSRRLAAWVREIGATRKLGCIYAVSSQMAGLAVTERRDQTRLVMDFVDVDSEKWRLRAERSGWPLSWLYRREARCLLAHDAAVAGRVDACLFVSEVEAARFRSLVPDAVPAVQALANGVDADRFSPERDYPDPYDGTPTLVFTGTMDYWPNEAAVAWFATRVLPRLRRSLPELRFAIVGRNPSRAVRALAALDGVEVVGGVPEVTPYLAHAAAVVVPLQDSPGIANKVLEGMAMARPVIAAPEAAAGLALEAGGDVIVADGADAFVEAVQSIMAKDEAARALGRRARERAQRDYSWAAVTARLPAIVEGSARA